MSGVDVDRTGPSRGKGFVTDDMEDGVNFGQVGVARHVEVASRQSRSSGGLLTAATDDVIALDDEHMLGHRYLTTCRKMIKYNSEIKQEQSTSHGTYDANA